MSETQHLLEKIRPPRVCITYDVEVGDAIEMKELPFVVGVIADLSGTRDPNNPLEPLKQRRFAEIDVDSFNTIMASCDPVAAFQVPNLLESPTPAPDAEPMNLMLRFETLDDFGPVNVIQQVPEMAAIYNTITQLNNLLTRLDGNDALDTMLTTLMSDKNMQAQLTQALTPPAAAPAAPASEDASPNKTS